MDLFKLMCFINTFPFLFKSTRTAKTICHGLKQEGHLSWEVNIARRDFIWWSLQKLSCLVPACHWLLQRQGQAAHEIRTQRENT